MSKYIIVLVEYNDDMIVSYASEGVVEYADDEYRDDYSASGAKPLYFDTHEEALDFLNEFLVTPYNCGMLGFTNDTFEIRQVS